MYKSTFTTIKVISLIAVFIVSSSSAFAAKKKKAIYPSYHFGYVSGGAGYCTMTKTLEGLTFQNAFDAFGGAGYEYRYRGLYANIGLQYARKQIGIQASPFTTSTFRGADGDGDSITCSYIVNQSDKYSWQTLDVPVQVGYYYKGFYVGAGMKYSMLIGSAKGMSANVSGTYDLIGKYDNGVVVRDQDFFKQYEIKSKNSYKIKPYFSVTAEIGYDVLATLPNRLIFCNILKVGLYAEYGFYNLLPTYAEGQTLSPTLTFSEKVDTEASDQAYNPTKVDVNPYLMSHQIARKKASPISFGVKLTYLIGGSKQILGTRSKGCPCYEH